MFCYHNQKCLDLSAVLYIVSKRDTLHIGETEHKILFSRIRIIASGNRLIICFRCVHHYIFNRHRIHPESFCHRK